MELIRVKKQPKNVRRLKVVGGHRAENRTLLEAEVFPRAYKSARVLLERHEKPCGCSYCREPWGHLPVQLRLPKDKGKTSWRVIALKLWSSTIYLRWTLVIWKPLPTAPEPPPPAEPEIRVHRFEVN